MKRYWKMLAAGFLGAGLLGCTSVPAPYIPKQVGNVRSGSVHDGLEVYIQPQSEQAYIGAPILFDITIRNTGDHAYWIPKQPNVNFRFVYANGRRDNYLEDDISDHSRYYGETDAVLLRPGHQLTQSFPVKTYYFARAGITEFYAILQEGQNDNRALTPCWSGKVVSNSYGVLVEPSRDPKGLGGLIFGKAPSRGQPST